MQPFRLVSSQANNVVPFAGNCEPLTYDSAHLNVFAATLSYCQPHWHEAPELIIVLQGQVVLSVNQQELTLHSGDFAYIGADCIHALAAQTQCSLLTWQFSPELADNQRIFPPGFAHFPAQSNSATELRQTGEALLQELIQSPASFFSLQAKTFALLALVEAKQNLLSEEQPKTPVQYDSREESVIRQSIAYINESFTTPITIAELAQRSYLSYSHFSRLFKKISGYSPSDYLAMVRVNHAKPLLKNMQIHITEIAEKAGFAEHRAMLAAFKKYCGMTPTEYRKHYYADFEWRADDSCVGPTANKPLSLSTAFTLLSKLA